MHPRSSPQTLDRHFDSDCFNDFAREIVHANSRLFYLLSQLRCIANGIGLCFLIRVVTFADTDVPTSWGFENSDNGHGFHTKAATKRGSPPQPFFMEIMERPDSTHAVHLSREAWFTGVQKSRG